VATDDDKGKIMKRKWLLVTALLLTTGQVIGCQKRTSFDPKSAGTFFPLRPSLSWTYRVIDRKQATASTFTDRVVEDRRIGTLSAGEIESEYSGPTGMFSTTILYVPEGGYLTRQSGNVESGRFLLAERAFLPQVLKPGLTWSNSVVPFADQPDAFHVTQLHRTFFERREVVVPAGRFFGCIRIETEALYQGDSSHEDPPLRLKYLDWYAPQVGLVKTLVMKSGFFGSELARIELLNFGRAQLKTATRVTNSTPDSPLAAKKSLSSVEERAIIP
jgi:hypothetical protein